MEIQFNILYRDLGHVVGNLLGLEFHLRLFLSEALETSQQPDAKSTDLEGIHEGDWLPCNHLTNSSSLGPLIDEANVKLAELGYPERLDPTLADLRDALAHGRIFSTVSPSGPFRLVKFSRPTNGTVQVKVAIELTPEWLQLQIRRTTEEYRRIATVRRRLLRGDSP
jgi:hypothetical protein